MPNGWNAEYKSVNCADMKACYTVIDLPDMLTIKAMLVQ